MSDMSLVFFRMLLEILRLGCVSEVYSDLSDLIEPGPVVVAVIVRVKICPEDSLCISGCLCRLFILDPE